MKKIVKLLLISFILIVSTPISAADLPISIQKKMHFVLEKSMPAVVNIVCRGEFSLINDPFLRRELEKLKGKRLPNQKQFSSVGSGVIVDAKQGIIVTNAHVIDQAKTITVTLNDGRRYQADKIGADTLTDVAILQIHAKNLKALPLANSSKIRVGDFVVAIGSPFGLSQTVTSGIVSGLHRTGLGIEGIENFIQTDAPINVGNSGGALVNIKGQLIGINTALLSNDGGNLGIGFSIPVNMVKSVMKQLMLYGKIHRGLIGILAQTLTPDLANALGVSNMSGAIIAQIMPHSPAKKAGLKMGDIIIRINNKDIKKSDDIHNTISLVRSGSTVKTTIQRQGKILHFTLKIIDPKSRPAEQFYTSHYLVGLHLQNTTEQTPKHGYIEGVKILTVDHYSAAWLAGLRPNDIIVSANQQPTKTIKTLEKISAKKYPFGLLLNIFRASGAGFIVIQ